MRPIMVVGLVLFVAGCGRSTDDWLRQLHDRDVVKRRQAIRELGSRTEDAERVVAALTEALRDESGYVRHDAATAVAKFGAAAKPAAPALTQAVASARAGAAARAPSLSSHERFQVLGANANLSC